MAVCPFADQSRRYDGRYAGSYVPGFGFRGVLHTTETTSLPGYKGGASAPHFTVDPRTGRIWQHYDTGRPSRALKHPAGTVDTNNARAIQIEIIAYSDAAIASRVGGLVIDRLTPAQLAPLTKLMRWIETTHKVSSASGLTFKPYPSSAGLGNGVRLGATAWRAFGGWCGHQHVPVNDHGDPSDIAITHLLTQVTPTVTAEEFHVATTDDAKTLWGADIIAAPAGSPANNPTWAPASYLKYTFDAVRRIEAQNRALTAVVTALAQSSGLDATQLEQTISDAVDKALGDLTITLTNNGG